MKAGELEATSSWYVSPTTAAIVEAVIVTAMVTMVIEGRRKRAIRRTLELAFLNHPHSQRDYSDEHGAVRPPNQGSKNVT
jgi:hypothetical protein